MESTRQMKPRVFYTGDIAGWTFLPREDVGEVLVETAPEGPTHADVLWVDCSTTKPDQYVPLLKAALDACKTLVLNRLDARAHEAVRQLVGSQVEARAETVLISRNLQAQTPFPYTLTVLGDAADTNASAASTTRDWSALFETHRASRTLSTGGSGLIPPPGVLFGIRTETLETSFEHQESFILEKSRSQRTGFSTNRSFYIYRENGKPRPEFVVIRVMQALLGAEESMLDEDHAKGHRLYEVSLTCSNSRKAQLIATSPESPLGPSLITQLTLPLQVKYMRDGSCTPQTWWPSHGPVAHPSDGWGLSNRSDFHTGTAEWVHFHSAPWNSQVDKPSDHSHWVHQMFEGSVSSGRVKPLNLQARSTFAVENVAAWRFSADDVEFNPEVTFDEVITSRTVLFVNGRYKYSRSDEEKHVRTHDRQRTLTPVTLNLIQETEDLTSPCR